MIPRPTDPRTQLGRARHWLSVSCIRNARRLNAIHEAYARHYDHYWERGQKDPACSYCMMGVRT